MDVMLKEPTPQELVPVPTRRCTPLRVVLGTCIGLVMAFVVAYVAFFTPDSPPALTLSSAGSSEPGPAVGAPEGVWTVAPGSVAGYRVREKLAALPAKSDAVGRSPAVTGAVRVDRSGGSLVATDASFEVDLTKLTSDESRRDNRIRTDGLETNRFPKATFASTRPIPLPAEPAGGQAVTVQGEGDLTLHGVTRRVTIPLDVRVTGNRGELAGSYSFPMSDFNITPPSIGGFVTVDPDATLEFKLVLEKA